MRVLHILNDLKPSGAETMLRTAASYWCEKNFTNDILCTGNTLGEYAFILKKAGYNIHHIPPSSPHYFLMNVYRLLKKNSYDVVHIHTERANFWYALCGYTAGSKYIIRTIHNVFAFEPKKRLERSIQRLVMRKIFGVKMISIGTSVKNNELKAFRNSSIVIPNWFDDSKFKPPSLSERHAARKSLNISDDVMVFTSIGGCSTQKNHTSIIKALAKLPKKASMIYVHVGPEAEGCPERKLAETACVSHRVCFLGTVLDIAPILYASDVYVMPSFYEGFGIAAIEAMGTGLPAILSDVPGLCDFREVCGSVYWVEPTCESIAKAMLHCLDMARSDLRDIGLELSHCIHRIFTVENGAEAYACLYRGC